PRPADRPVPPCSRPWGARARRSDARRATGPSGLLVARPGGRRSVAVVLRLVRALDRDAEVLGLGRRELGEAHAERVEVQAGHLLVQHLGQAVDLARVRALAAL